MMTLTKLQELFKNTVMQALSVQYILCRLGDARKSIASMLKMSPKHVWSEVGASHQDSTYLSSEMRGALDEKYKNKQHEKAMKAPIDEDKIRKAGW